MAKDKIRVVRLVIYEGRRDLVERQLAGSVHGIRHGVGDGTEFCTIQAVTLGVHPDILEEGKTDEVVQET